MNTKTFSPNCSPPRAVKQKPKTKQMKTKKPTTKAKNRWTLVSNELLTFNEVIKTSVPADTKVSQSKPKHHLQDPAVEAKRREAVQLYWKKKRMAKEASKRYNERYGLKCVSARIPSHIVESFQYICEKEGLCRAEVIARLLNGFIQRNSYPNTK